MSSPIPLGNAGIPEALRLIGAFRRNEYPDPSSLSWTISAKSGGGKTSLLCSYPNAALLDLEGGTFLCPDTTAIRIFCPVLNDDELTPQLKEPDPSLRRPSATSLRTAAQTLLDMAQQPGNPIRTVCIDSAELLQLMLTSELERGWGESAGQRGQSAWRDINKVCSAFIQQFQNVGYSVAVAVHLKDEFKDMKGGTSVFTKPTITDGFVEALKKRTDFTLQIVAGSEFDPAKGESVPRFNVLTESTAQRKGNYGLKRRVALPAVIEDIPLVGGMSKIFAVCNDAIDNLRNTYGQGESSNG